MGACLPAIVRSRLAAATTDDAWMAAILARAGPTVRRVLAAPQVFEAQCVLTRLQRDTDQRLQVISKHSIGVDRRRWFAAASFVKLPLAAILCEALQQKDLLDRIGSLRLQIEPGSSCAALPAPDPRGWSVLSLLRSMLIVSDNRSYNALYELFGSDTLHTRLAALGYVDVRIPTRMGGCGAARKAHAFLVDDRARRVWDSPAASELPQRFPFGRALQGRAWAEGGKPIPGPHDFSASNFMPLEDVHRMLLDINGVNLPAGPRFALNDSAQQLLREILSTVPRLSVDPKYVESHYADNHSKYLSVGGAPQRLPAGLAISNKNAQSYGYLADSAIIQEPAKRIAFALTAVVYVNRDGVLNDARYEYDSIGLPFLRELGQAALAQERSMSAG